MCTWYFLKIAKISSRKTQKWPIRKSKTPAKISCHTVGKYHTTLPDWVIKWFQPNQGYKSGWDSKLIRNVAGGIFPLGFDAKKSTPGTRIPQATQATIATLLMAWWIFLQTTEEPIPTFTKLNSEGYYGGIPKGIVRVGINVGSCVGKKAADAYTGWNSVTQIMIEEVPPPQGARGQDNTQRRTISPNFLLRF